MAPIRSNHRLAVVLPSVLLLLLVLATAPPLVAHDAPDAPGGDACTCTARHADQGGATPPPLDLPAFRERLAAYYYSGGYEDDIRAVVNEARAYLEQRLEEGVEKPAMVLDIDETSLSNWAHMEAVQFGYEPGLWREWVETASAYGIGPTLELARWAKSRGVALFFITGRDEEERAATERNLTSVGYAPWQELFLEHKDECCVGESCDYAATCKSFYRKRIADQGYTLVVNLGDQRSDLLGGWSERAYKLPNPFYFVP